MIQLRSDCLIVKQPSGNDGPSTAEAIAVQLLGPQAAGLNAELLREICAAVLHYFRDELGKTSISVVEFAQALRRVLEQFGCMAQITVTPPASEPRVPEADLRILACRAGKGFELTFFQTLRDELRDLLRQSPEVIRFKGLRGCVKQLVGARRWSRRCEVLSDQIVQYLRLSLSHDVGAGSCSLVVH
jgi:hypothetical protein